LRQNFKRHRAEYYRQLNAVRTDGDFENWLKYFLEGVAVIADESVLTTQKLFTLTSVDRAKILSGRSTCSPQTLTRAARDFAVKNPGFAIEAGMAVLNW
jgi:Fic family protein